MPQALKQLQLQAQQQRDVVFRFLEHGRQYASLSDAETLVSAYVCVLLFRFLEHGKQYASLSDAETSQSMTLVSACVCVCVCVLSNGDVGCESVRHRQRRTRACYLATAIGFDERR